MDKTLREKIEKEIDDLIKLENLEGIIGSFAENIYGFPFPAGDPNPSWFASVVGMLFLSFRGIVELWYRRQPTADEVREFREVIERRAGEIKSQIKLALSK